MSLTGKDRRRRLAARRSNERLKLGANFLNALGIGVVGAAFIVPGVEDWAGVRWTWLPLGAILHSMAQVLLTFLRSED